jgi:hypothetical protein
VDFSDSCNGKREELNDIRDNREKFIVLNSSLGTPDIVALAPFDSAEMLVACSFESRVVKCLPGETSCVVGAVERAVGDCRLTAVYEQARWWLCESRFLSDSPLTATMKKFFGR